MAPIAAPTAIPATIASGMLVLETMQTTIDAIPRMEPWEKSRPPIVMIKNTPVAEIIVTYTWESTRGRLFIIRKFVRALNIRKIIISPAIGRSERIIVIFDNFLSCCSLFSVLVLT